MAQAAVPGGNAPGGKSPRPTVVVSPDPLPEMMQGTMPRITVWLEGAQIGKTYEVKLQVEDLKTDVNGENNEAVENTRPDPKQGNKPHVVFVLTPEADGEATIRISSPSNEFDEVELHTPPLMSPPGLAPTPAPVPSRSPQSTVSPPPIGSSFTMPPPHGTAGGQGSTGPTLTPAPAAVGSPPPTQAAAPAPRARTATHTVPAVVPTPPASPPSATATTPTNPPRANAPAVPTSNRTKVAGMILAPILALAAVVIVLGVVYKLRHPEEVATNTEIIPDREIPIADAAPAPTPVPAPTATAEPATPPAPPEPIADAAPAPEPPAPEPATVAEAPEPAPPVVPETPPAVATAPTTPPAPTLPCAPYKNVLVKKGKWTVVCQDGTTELTCPDAKNVPGGLDLGVCRP